MRLSLIPVLLAVIVLSGACGGSGDDDRIILTPIDSEILPIVISSDLAIGENRFMVGLIKQSDNGQILGADLKFRFFQLQGDTGTFRFEADVNPVRITKTYSHTHPDGMTETHEAGETGVYVAYVDFDMAGTWGVEVTGTTEAGEELDPIRPSFSVAETAFGLNIGDPAPLTVQRLASDVADIRDIDTSLEPILDEHNLTIADAVRSGKPTVIAFATPAFCQSQVCGPTKEVFDDAYLDYKGQANFVHIEPYDVPKMREGSCTELSDCLVPALSEWRLESEPWVFVVDADGRIAAKFDGIVSLKELETAIELTLA